MTKATKIMRMAKETKSVIRWRLLKGQFSKLLGESVRSWDVYCSAMREFNRVAPRPKFECERDPIQPWAK